MQKINNGYIVLNFNGNCILAGHFCYSVLSEMWVSVLR